MNDNLFVSRIEDMAFLSSKKGGSVFSDFLDPKEQLTGGREMGRYTDLECTFFGGHVYTERKIMAIYPAGQEAEKWEYPIRVLRSRQPLDVRHQDVLGAALALGIERSKVGDINILEDGIQMFVYDTVCEFLENELVQIGRNRVSMYEIGLDEAIIVEPRFKEMNIIVPSMRLDAVIGNIFRLSRNEANMFVKGGRVKVNHFVQQKPASKIKAGDILSVRTKGRAIVDSVTGTTRKGNIKLKVKKFI